MSRIIFFDSNRQNSQKALNYVFDKNFLIDTNFLIEKIKCKKLYTNVIAIFSNDTLFFKHLSFYRNERHLLWWPSIRSKKSHFLPIQFYKIRTILSNSVGLF